tara:strand:- start:13 stop:570 length:558 start_codon:yes stop_codon:yes gene_type:complete
MMGYGNILLIVVVLTIIAAALATVIFYFVDPNPLELHDSISFYMIGIAIFGAICAILKPHLLRRVHEIKMRNYGMKSKNLESRLKSARVMLGGNSPPLGNRSRASAMSLLSEDHGVEMKTFQQFLDWEESKECKMRSIHLEADGDDSEKGSRDRGLHFVRLVRSPLDVRIQLLTVRAQYIVVLSE